MKATIPTLCLACLLLLLPTAARGDTQVVIDFEHVPANTVVSVVETACGLVHFTPNEYRTYPSDCCDEQHPSWPDCRPECPCGDWDLGFSGIQGNTLIQQEMPPRCTPDDSGSGAYFRIDPEEIVTSVAMQIGDVDDPASGCGSGQEGEVTLRAWDPNGDLIRWEPCGCGDRCIEDCPRAVCNPPILGEIDYVEIECTSSCALDFIELTCGSEPASLGDFVWWDYDMNHRQDGEDGVENVTVNLLDDSGSLLQSTTTNGDGWYEFSGLDPDLLYIVEFVAPQGTMFCHQDEPGVPDTLDSDADPATGRTGVIDLDPGEHDPTWDAGLVLLGSLGDWVWYDYDMDHHQDPPGEPGLPDVEVNLLDCEGNTLASTLTDQLGFYLFPDLVPGCYMVEFVKPDPNLWEFCHQDEPGVPDTEDSDADPETGRTDPIDLGWGEDDMTWDAGLAQPVPTLPSAAWPLLLLLLALAALWHARMMR